MFLVYFYNNETAMETLGTVRSVPPTARAREICAQKNIMSDLLKNSADIAGSYSGIVDDAISYSQEGRQIMIDQIEAIGFGATTAEKAARETWNMYNRLAENQ